jgi:GT2 family glycosyltransferase
LLRFFTTRHDLPEIETEDAVPFTLRNAAEFTNKTIPFSHIYVTSETYLRRIKKSLNEIDESHGEKIIELHPQQQKALLSHQRFPLDFKKLELQSVSQLHQTFQDKKTVHIVIINGYGMAFGDNFVALSVMQRLIKLAAPVDLHFHLMQTMNKKIAAVYENEKNIHVYNNCVPATIFLKMDFHVNLTGMLGFPEFDQLPLSSFMASMLSVNQLLPNKDIKPKISTDPARTAKLKHEILKRFERQLKGLRDVQEISSTPAHHNKKLVLFHPKASSKIRTMEVRTASKIVNELIEPDYLVISAFPYPNPSNGFLDCSELSNDINDLLHIIDACDAVISVGTAVYHLSAALHKPTLLLPTVQADVDSGALLSDVLTYLPEESKQYISPKHKSSEKEDIRTANIIWRNINTQDLVSTLSKHCQQFSVLEHNNIKRVLSPLSPPKVGVIIPHYGTQEKLNKCLDALVKVDGFDPQWLYTVDNNTNNRLFTVGVNHGLEQALKDGCDYLWILNNDTQPEKDYIKASIRRFQANEKVGIVGGKNLVTEKPDRIFWGGSHQAFPTGVHKAGYVSRNSLAEATQESWATFSSVIIRRETMEECGLLDGSMKMIFSDSDYCFTVGLKGWQVWYEPEAVILHDTGVSRKAPNQQIIDIFRQDKHRFYHKWVGITGENDPEKLQEAIFKKIGWQTS